MSLIRCTKGELNLKKSEHGAHLNSKYCHKDQKAVILDTQILKKSYILVQL